MTRRWALGYGILAAFCGCSGQGELDRGYGRGLGDGLNGTRALARMFESAGVSVRTSSRLRAEAFTSVDVLVRFAPFSGLPDRRETDVFEQWLSDGKSRRLIYVIRDFDAEPEYWTAIRDRLSEPERSRRASEIERLESEARARAAREHELADVPPERADYWFELFRSDLEPVVCKTIDGPWAEGVRASEARVVRHCGLAIEPDSAWETLFEGDGVSLVAEGRFESGQKILVVANGCFLLNETLANPARRPLARRLVDWGLEGDGRTVLFIEGANPTELDDRPSARSGLHVLGVEPFNWIFAQMGLLGLVGVLATAARLGRPRPPTERPLDRPAEHAIALGAVLSRAPDASTALVALEAYERWRRPGAGAETNRTRST